MASALALFIVLLVPPGIAPVEMFSAPAIRPGRTAVDVGLAKFVEKEKVLDRAVTLQFGDLSAPVAILEEENSSDGDPSLALASGIQSILNPPAFETVRGYRLAPRRWRFSDRSLVQRC